MAFGGIVDYWNQLVNSGDIRSKELPFVQEPTVVICASVLYLGMVIVGPWFMEKREPLAIRKVLIGYNFFSVVFSMWMMWEFIACSLLNPNFDLICHDLDEKDTSPLTLRLVNAHWWYFFSKFIECFDTLFFVIRKKNNQVSFLHVYHHVAMVMFQWCVVKYVPGGMSYFGPLLNCFIHSVMYTYYMLSAFGPHMQKYLWWKKYLTRMQMVQFTLVISFLLNALRIECRWWNALNYMTLLFTGSLLILFARFYVKDNQAAPKKKLP